MITYNTVSELSVAQLVVGDVVQILGEESLGDRAFMMGIVREPSFVSGNRLITITQGLKVEIMPDLVIDSTESSDSEVIASGTSARRKLKDRFTDIVSVKDFGAVGNSTTDDQDAIVRAVAFCKANNTKLNWPAGTYLSSASIPDLHSVRHIGGGVIKRGTDLFYVEIGPSQKNTIYVGGAGGAFENDGITVTEPLRTFQPAFDLLKNYGPTLQGLWTLQISAGNYSFSEKAQTLGGIRSINRIVIQGPDVGGHPNVPTAILDGLKGGFDPKPYSHGLNLEGSGLKVTVKDLKFQNFTGDSGTSSSGTRGCLLIDNGADVYTNNVHVKDASWFGIYPSKMSSLRMQGGIIDGCRNGVVTDMAKVTVGYGASTLAQGPIFRNCGTGIYWLRNTDGHVDYTTMVDNGTGLWIEMNSRVDAVGCDFQKNTYGVRTSCGGLFLDNGYKPCKFNQENSALANRTDVYYNGYSGLVEEIKAGATELRVAYKRETISVTGTDEVPNLIYTIPASRLKGVNKSLRFKFTGLITCKANSDLIVDIGGHKMTFRFSTTSTNSPFIVEGELYEVSGGYRSIGTAMYGSNSTRVTGSSGNFVNTQDNPLTITPKLLETTDKVSIYRSEVFITG